MQPPEMCTTALGVWWGVRNISPCLLQGSVQEQHAAMGWGCAGEGRRQQPQAAPKSWFNSQPGARLTHGSPAAFIVSREFLHEVQLGLKARKGDTLLNSGQKDV